jgi:hypothetical protein
MYLGEDSYLICYVTLLLSPTGLLSLTFGCIFMKRKPLSLPVLYNELWYKIFILQAEKQMSALQ